MANRGHRNMHQLSPCLAVVAVTLFPFWAVQGSVLKTDNVPSQCVVVVNNEETLKEVGAKWVGSDPCAQFSCELDEFGMPEERRTMMQCEKLRCDGEYESRSSPKQCCSKCVKTKCEFEGRLYKVGETWHNGDSCSIAECSLDEKGEAFTSVYQKACPKVPPTCPKQDIVQEGCCLVCREKKKPAAQDYDDAIMDEEFYRKHPCVRDCALGGAPMVCNYTFVVEWYETLSKACFDCPNNLEDCQRPHCIFADGVRRSVTVVNRMMPGPSIEVCLNDTIVVDVQNHLLGESTTIHWHGLHQKTNPYMDGVPHVSQCPIQPHSTFRYMFKADAAGTHFWHSHTGMQRGDGCFGALIVRQPRALDAHSKLYDFDLPEHKMIVQDWVHVVGVAMFSSHHHSIGDNKPPNILMNGKGRYFPAVLGEKEEPLAEEVLKIKSKEAEYALNEVRGAKVLRQGTWDSSAEVLSKNEANFTGDSSTEEESSTVFTVLSQDPLPNEPSNESSSNLPPNTVLQMAPNDRQKRSLAQEDVLKFPLEKFTVVPGFSYRFRIINAEFLNCPIAISVDNHTLNVISSDGYDLEPVAVSAVVTYAGERFDFVLEANQPPGNYWVRMKGLMDCDERFTSAFQVAILHYDGAGDEEPSDLPAYDFSPGGIELNALNKGSGYVDSLTIAELNSIPTLEDDSEWLRGEPDHKFFVYYDFYPKDNPTFHLGGFYGINETRKLFTPQLNHISMKMPALPLLPARDLIDDSMFCNETSLAAEGKNCREEFCSCHHVLQVELGSVVEIIFVDEGVTYDANHPFHLHGNAFYVLGLERVGKNVTIETIKSMDRAGQLKRNFNRPPLKDTVTVPDGGYTIIRFKALNPGYWLMHCHIEFHAEIGMALVLKVGGHEQMMPVPRNFPQCADFKPNSMEEMFPSGSAVVTLEERAWLFVILLSLRLVF